MKTAFATLALVVLSSTFASANIKPEGTFVPHQCSTSTKASKFFVCFGMKVGKIGQYIEISAKGKSSQLFMVTSRKSINGGINPSFGAENIVMRDENGMVATATVRYTTGINNAKVATSIQGVLPNGKTFAANGFQFVMTTM